MRCVVALAAVSCLRSLAGFVFPLFAPDMYKALGFGKGDTLLAGIAILFGCPAYVLSSVPGSCFLTPGYVVDHGCSGITGNVFAREASMPMAEP